MPYSITTKDGITINNIPDDIDPNSDVLRQRVAKERAGNQEQAQSKQDLVEQNKASSEQIKADLFKQQAEELNPLEAAAVGAGRGLTQLGRLFGIADDEDPATAEAFKALETESPIATTIGEVVGESAPFLIPGLGQGAAAARLGGGAIARGVTAGGLGALEGGIVAAANDQDATTGALIGGGVGAGAEFLFPKIGKAFRKLRGVEPSTNLITPNGALSPKFEEALFDEGLTVGNLVEATKLKLPAIASEASATGGRMSEAQAAKQAAKAVVKKQLQSGGRDDALATVRLRGGQVVDDDLASEVIKQGYNEGTTNLAKTANFKTRKEMAKALDLAVNIKGQSRSAQGARPSDFAGDALYERFNFINNSIKKDTKTLNEIATKQLTGEIFDIAPMNKNINDMIERLNITNKAVPTAANPTPKPELDFKGSLIDGDSSSISSIKGMIDVLGRAKMNDALGAHKMKRSLDNFINFRKEPARGLGKEGEIALKGVRTSINDTLRNFSPDYAKVNDKLSMSLDAVDNLKSAVGKSLDLDNAEIAGGALGTKIRILFSNYQKRTQNEAAFNQIDDVAAKLGGNFETDYKDIFQFTNGIEDVWGQTAQTSLGGVLAADKAASKLKGGIKGAIVDKGLSMADKKLQKMQKINEYNAFTKMRELLRRGQ